MSYLIRVRAKELGSCGVDMAFEVYMSFRTTHVLSVMVNCTSYVHFSSAHNLCEGAQPKQSFVRTLCAADVNQFTLVQYIVSFLHWA